MAAVQGSDVSKVIIACEAGMGSSVMLVSQMRKKLEGYGVAVDHSPVNQIPDDGAAEPDGTAGLRRPRGRWASSTRRRGARPRGSGRRPPGRLASPLRRYQPRRDSAPDGRSVPQLLSG